MIDFLNRKNVKDGYSDEEFCKLVEIAKNNLLNIPTIIAENLRIHQNIFGNMSNMSANMSDNDIVVTAKLGSSILSNIKCDLYFTDNWELLLDNFLINNEKSEKKLIDVRTLYSNDDQYKKGVVQAKNILSKQPPQSFIDKWPIIGNEAFRIRVSQNDNDAIIATRIALLLNKGQQIKEIYNTCNWELLINNLNVLTV